MIKTILITLLAAPVGFRVACTLDKVRRTGFGCAWRFQGFAIGYAALGALTGWMVIDSWNGLYVPWGAVGFLFASALFVLFDQRRPKV